MLALDAKLRRAPTGSLFDNEYFTRKISWQVSASISPKAPYEVSFYKIHKEDSSLKKKRYLKH